MTANDECMSGSSSSTSSNQSASMTQLWHLQQPMTDAQMRQLCCQEMPCSTPPMLQGPLLCPRAPKHQFSLRLQAGFEPATSQCHDVSAQLQTIDDYRSSGHQSNQAAMVTGKAAGMDSLMRYASPVSSPQDLLLRLQHKAASASYTAAAPAHANSSTPVTADTHTPGAASQGWCPYASDYAPEHNAYVSRLRAKRIKLFGPAISSLPSSLHPQSTLTEAITPGMAQQQQQQHSLTCGATSQRQATDANIPDGAVAVRQPLATGFGYPHKLHIPTLQPASADHLPSIPWVPALLPGSGLEPAPGSAPRSALGSAPGSGLDTSAEHSLMFKGSSTPEMAARELASTLGIERASPTAYGEGQSWSPVCPASPAAHASGSVKSQPFALFSSSRHQQLLRHN